ncbi:MAG: hypothetical protein H6742_16610 [Alphaproteobacteria bacterium]|nr:hypothetical protein [Alphaproteobacteria bacterium]
MSPAPAPDVDAGGRQRLDPNQQALVARARALGIETVDLSGDWGCDAVRYRKGDREALVFMGQQFPSLTAHGATLCDHKHACKALLADAGLRVPEGVFFFSPDGARAALQALLDRHGRVVVKPVDGMHGDGIRTGIVDMDALVAHWRTIRSCRAGFLAEQQVEGDDLRIQAIGGRLVAACRREPASVVGDGRQTIAALSAARDAVCRAQNPLNRLILDDDSRALLADQGLHPDDVPAAGRAVRLKSLTNISMGGRPVDVTDRLHAAWPSVVETIARVLGLSIFSVDVLTADPGLPPDAGHVIEVNARPEWLHHTFSEGRQHDIAGMILAELLG